MRKAARKRLAARQRWIFLRKNPLNHLCHQLSKQLNFFVKQIPWSNLAKPAQLTLGTIWTRGERGDLREGRKGSVTLVLESTWTHRLEQAKWSRRKGREEIWKLGKRRKALTFPNITEILLLYISSRAVCLFVVVWFASPVQGELVGLVGEPFGPTLTVCCSIWWMFVNEGRVVLLAKEMVGWSWRQQNYKFTCGKSGPCWFFSSGSDRRNPPSNRARPHSHCPPSPSTPLSSLPPLSSNYLPQFLTAPDSNKPKPTFDLNGWLTFCKTCISAAIVALSACNLFALW